MRKTALCVVLMAAMLPGCKWFKSASKDNIDLPTPLTEFNQTTRIQRLWSAGVSHDKGRSGGGLRPAVVSGRVYLAGIDGELQSLVLESGKRLWKVKAASRFSGGPGSDGRRVVIGALDGEVLAFDAEDGELLWQAQLSAEVLTAPLVTPDVVVVRSNDGRIHGLEASTGKSRWAYTGSVPLLSLRGNAAPLLENGMVIMARDDGKVTALNLDDGKLRWEQSVNLADGRNELDRLIDIDGQMRADRGDVFLSAYNGNTLALIAETGAQLWTVDAPSVSGLDINASLAVVAQSDGVVRAVDRRSGVEIWKQEALKFRLLGAPLIEGENVLVGDAQGYLHTLNVEDGALSGRERLGKSRLSGPAQRADGVVVAQDIRGKVAAYRLGQR